MEPALSNRFDMYASGIVLHGPSFVDLKSKKPLLNLPPQKHDISWLCQKQRGGGLEFSQEAEFMLEFADELLESISTYSSPENSRS